MRSITEDSIATNCGRWEGEKRGLDTAATRSEHERVSTNWIKHKVPWSELHNEREINAQPNITTIDSHDHSWGENMKKLIDFLIEESEE